jgi:hypothetical protein
VIQNFENRAATFRDLQGATSQRFRDPESAFSIKEFKRITPRRGPGIAEPETAAQAPAPAPAQGELSPLEKSQREKIALVTDQPTFEAIDKLSREQNIPFNVAARQVIEALGQ